MEALFSSAKILTGREIQEKKSMIAELTNFEKALCGMLKERNSSRKVQGFTFYASVKGSQMTYPAGKAAAGAAGGICTVCKCQIYWRYWYKSTNTGAEKAKARAATGRRTCSFLFGLRVRGHAA
jgi:hypothetical protein